MNGDDTGVSQDSANPTLSLRCGVAARWLPRTLGASVLLAVFAALHPARGARVLLAFMALDVISFAVAQGVSLLRRGVRS